MVASHTSLAESNPEPPRSRTLPDSGSSSEKEEEQTPSREVRDEGRVRERKREWDRRSSCSAQTASSSRLSSVGDDSANKSETSVTPSGAKGIADSPVYSIAAFQEKYHEYDLLGEGGCGCVFAGFRRADNLPVAIKHISRQNHICTHFDENGKLVFSEVAIMARVASKKSSCVALLDWYLLEHELILVMERPVPSMDLFMYINTKCKRPMTEGMAKVIMKQLVTAAVGLAKKGVYHRDIKTENVLMETNSDSPRIHLIDFGFSVLAEKNASYDVFYGTAEHLPPEWYTQGSYRVESLTVWQIGVVLFEILHKGMFETQEYMQLKKRSRRKLSEGCQDFLNKCLTVSPEQRPTLDRLRYHPWLRIPKK
ncbi:serine/threonine-protein kinase pim-1-like isoform X2 [Synchiropus splendidus]|uniref:serine/threonine-protein kinase pim-1-like isoform X2 n=1 Tax=Synchiropus splendidus TaxID=270530 RepID=UPI00237D5BD8|nr:serine/threonine-protein kinase pim-1-like isoform X2 [Synchiropus splendidus]